MTHDPDDASWGSGGDDLGQGDQRPWLPPPPDPQDPYPAQAYGYGGLPLPAQTSGKATAIMVLGIVGLVMACFYGIGLILAIVALVMAPGARREIESSGGRLVGAGQIKAGVICSWVTVGLVLAAVALGIGLAVLAPVHPSG